MTITQDHISADTPLGATLVADGATFRVWAPNAREVHLKLDDDPDWAPGPSTLLAKDAASGTWGGFVAGVGDGTRYRFFVVGDGGSGFKRDPYARELGPGWPDCDGIVRDPGGYPWHDRGFRPPPFNDLVLYELHVGVFYAVGPDGTDRRVQPGGTFLDVLGRLPYLADLGFNAVELMPVIEFETSRSMGYNGADLFSPDGRYTIAPDDPAFASYVQTVNDLLAAKGQPPLRSDQLAGQVNQLKAMIDIAHLYGLAVLLDVVYNHAGGGYRPDAGFDPESLYFFDEQAFHSNADSLYFTNQGEAGGLVFDYQKDQVRQFLIDNAAYFLRECHVDGFRYDEVTVIDENGGWRFCQDLTSTVRFLSPAGPQVAEYWRDDPSWAIRPREQGGAGFDAVWYPGLRDAIRGAIGQATGGRDASVALGPIAGALGRPANFAAAWRAVQFLESHDNVYAGHADRKPRVAALADPTDARSWYARSRARVATGLLLTAPGIPMLFMGQEVLEDKPWSDSPDPSFLVWWDGLRTDRAMQGHLQFTRDLVRLRRRYRALRGEPIHVFVSRDLDRILAFHRWIDGEGRDVVVVASLNESTFWQYRIGFPRPGTWLEVFNSDAYDNGGNPQVAGNGGSITADGPPMDDLPCSATIVIPANGVLVFARDGED
jgi:1,4-alpha-glucan branching enzyme